MKPNTLSRRTFLRNGALGAAGAALLSAEARAAAAKPAKPNIVVILADDMGYADLGIMGGKDIPTPNIDSIARGGVRFTNSYVSCPYCSPTRAGLQTGRYQQRFGHEFNEGAPREKFGLPLSETTFAQRMKALGYVTGAIGKWHLGVEPQFRPMNRGYDEFYGTLSNTPYIHPMLLDSRVSPDPKKVEDASFYTTDAYGERAVEFIKQHKGEPFFLYLPFNAVHVPMQATEKYLSRFSKIENQERQTYAAMLSALDDAVGRVLGALRENGLEENTLVFFLPDNGGPMTKMGQNGSNNAPLKGQKGDTWEGAIHVPLFMQWKGRLPAGATYEKPVIQLDILPTSVAAVGGEVKPEWKLDGVNLLPFISGKDASTPHETLCWRFGPQWAIRQGDWKLVQGFDYDVPNLVQVNKTQVDPPMLFNLAQDPGETKDLAAENPEKVKQMQAAWQAWNKELAEPAWIPQPKQPQKQPKKPQKQPKKAQKEKAAKI